MGQPIPTNMLKSDAETPQTKIARFWEGIRQGKLFTTKCQKCGKTHFPPTSDCPSCYSSDMAWIELSGDAELTTWTLIQIKPRSFSQYPPYMIAIARIKEGPSVMAWLVDVKPEDVRSGMRLKLVAKQSPDGQLSYQLVPRQS